MSNSMIHRIYFYLGQSMPYIRNEDLEDSSVILNMSEEEKDHMCKHLEHMHTFLGIGGGSPMHSYLHGFKRGYESACKENKT